MDSCTVHVVTYCQSHGIYNTSSESKSSHRPVVTFTCQLSSPIVTGGTLLCGVLIVWEAVAVGVCGTFDLLLSLSVHKNDLKIKV